jgi:hypothetical protein
MATLPVSLNHTDATARDDRRLRKRNPSWSSTDSERLDVSLNDSFKFDKKIKWESLKFSTHNRGRQIIDESP